MMIFSRLGEMSPPGPSFVCPNREGGWAPTACRQQRFYERRPSTLAELIQKTKGAPANQSLVPLRPAANGLPLFFVHSRVFFFMYYRHLIDALKSDRPVYGLQPPAMDGKCAIPPHGGVHRADYVTEIRRVQPHGPYVVAGHSFGGRVSFEIAQQLVREGEQVSFLGLIDTAFRASPVVPSQKTMRPGRFGRRFGILCITRSMFGTRYLSGCLMCGSASGFRSRTDTGRVITICFVSARPGATWPSPIAVTSRCSAVPEIPNGKKRCGDRSRSAD